MFHTRIDSNSFAVWPGDVRSTLVKDFDIDMTRIEKTTVTVALTQGGAASVYRTKQDTAGAFCSELFLPSPLDTIHRCGKSEAGEAMVGKCALQQTGLLRCSIVVGTSGLQRQDWHYRCWSFRNQARSH